MAQTCDYCRGPLSGSSFLGRPWPDRRVAVYCCYGCLSLGETEIGERQSADKPRFRFDGFALRLGVGLLVAGQSMIFGLAINLEEQTSPAIKIGVQGIILAGTLLVIALLGPALFRNAFSEARRGRLTIEALFLITMVGAMAASLQSFISGHGPIYFEVVTVLLVVYALGKAIGAHSRAAALNATERWANSLGTCRLVDAAGRDRSIEVGMILPGDLVEVRPGEVVAIDGVIRSGTGFLSEAPVSGEPFAVVRRPGDCVLAGMASYDATFRIEATSSGASRQIDRLLDVVEQARSHPSSLQAQADRLGKVFFPIVVGVATFTFLFWSIQKDWETGLFNAMSVLLVACPCALGLATPIVIWSTLNRLAERGLVANSGDLIERLAHVDEVYFDKTGTLTEERFALVDIATLAEGEKRDKVLGWLALAEEQSQHPVARPFAQLPKPPVRGETPRVAAFTVIPGCGVEATIDDQRQSHRICIGRPDWIGQIGTRDEELLLARLHANEGHRIDCAIDGQLAAIAIVAERLRDSVPQTLLELERLGLGVNVLTGDDPKRAVALALPSVRGQLLPDDKRAYVLARKEAGGKPLMIGDGINDSSALASAHVGIALASGTDLANSAAAATLYHNDLRVIPWAIAVSRQAGRLVRRNLLRAASYNLIGITLAAFGILHPVAAALLMAVSSLLVAWSSVRIGIAPLGDCNAGACQPSEQTTPTLPRRWRAAMHAVALALQAVVFILLLSPSTPVALAAVLAFAIVAWMSAHAWRRAANIPHWLDMSYGMLTLGNLGMLLGWWADNGFVPLHDCGCCECVSAMRDGLLKPWMWVGMLVFANVAMLFLARRPYRDLPWCRTAMFTGGNLGMVGGMLLGGWLAGGWEMPNVNAAALASFLGMTCGMVAGMSLGAALMRRALVLAGGIQASHHSFSRDAEALRSGARRSAT